MPRSSDRSATRSPARLATTCLILACGYLSLGCPGDSTEPPTVTTVDLGGLSMLYDVGPTNLTSRDYVFYGGSSTGSMGFQLRLANLTNQCPLLIVSGDGSTVETLATNGTVDTTTIDGNVAILRADCGAVDQTPTVNVETMTFTGAGGVNFPQDTTTLANSVSSFPLRLNQPVELVFPEGSTKSYFFTLDGVAGQELDVVLDGSFGQVLIADPSAPSFEIAPADAFEVINMTAGGFDTFAVPDETNLLRLTVRNPSATGGHVRFSVNAPVQYLDLTARFMGLPGTAGLPTVATLTTALTPRLSATAQQLYQYTQGMVRLRSVRLFTGAAVGLTEAPVANIQIMPVTFPGGPLRQHAIPMVTVDLDLGWLTTMPVPTAGAVLAHEILHFRYLLPDEYSYLDNSALCPNSAMAVLSSNGLCWSGNHNPNGELLLVPWTSMWDALAAELGVAPPSSSPVHILRTVSSVTFPVPLTTVN